MTLNSQKVRNIFLFTGQGAQYYGMGRKLYEQETCFKKTMDELDEDIKMAGQESIVQILYPAGPKDSVLVFDRTLHTHPALFMVQIALAKSVMDKGIVPHSLMGASLGEYIALGLAANIPARTMLELLMAHAGVVEGHCSPGAMAGIVAGAELYHQTPELFENAALACINSPLHFVVSGDARKMDLVFHYLKAQKKIVQILPIRFGFHSANMDPVQGEWERILKESKVLPAGPLGLETISCCTGRLITEVSLAHLAAIPRAPIRFPQACDQLARRMRFFLSQGFEVNLIDLGPGGAGSLFMRQQGNLPKGVKVFRIMTPLGDEMKNMAKLEQCLGS